MFSKFVEDQYEEKSVRKSIGGVQKRVYMGFKLKEEVDTTA